MRSISIPMCVLAVASGSPTARADVHVVQLFDLEFVPRDVVIEVGDTVRWENVSGFHTVTSGVAPNADGFFNEIVDPFFPTFEVVFDETFLDSNPVPDDIYEYFCIPHASLDMLGTVAVTTSTVCPDGGTTGNYCVATPFSTGLPSTISTNKAVVAVSDIDFVLSANNLPHDPPRPGQFIAGQGQAQNPFQNGFLCVDPASLQRLKPITFPDATGVATLSVNFASGAQSPAGDVPINVVPGTTHYFQRWNRDPGVGAGSNTSNGIAVCIAVEGTGDCCENGDPRILTLQYTGDGCGASSHQQSSDSCEGDPAFAGTVFVRASDVDDPTDATGSSWFEGLVNLNGTFEVNAFNEFDGHLESPTFVHVFDAAGVELLQTVSINTACTEPLNVGDQFGSLRLLGCVGEDEFDADDLCAQGDPQVITMRYTGDDCSATSHSQPPSQVSCDGDPGLAATVFIRASNRHDPFSGSGKVWFEGLVDLGTTFDVDATNDGATSLTNATFIHVLTPGLEVLQTVRFRSSCNDKLTLEDQFGSLAIEGYVGAP